MSIEAERAELAARMLREHWAGIEFRGLWKQIRPELTVQVFNARTLFVRIACTVPDVADGEPLKAYLPISVEVPIDLLIDAKHVLKHVLAKFWQHELQEGVSYKDGSTGPFGDPHPKGT